jgi:hypothetical protein
LAWGLVLGGLVLIPWTIVLMVRLPAHYTGAHYRGSWVGFDLMLLTSMLVTGVAALRGARRLPLAAAATGTLLVVDAWFDVSGSGNITDFKGALAMALLFELPTAALCWIVALRAYRAAVPVTPEPTVESRRTTVTEEG